MTDGAITSLTVSLSDAYRYLASQAQLLTSQSRYRTEYFMRD